jgi:hypothetical protein
MCQPPSPFAVIFRAGLIAIPIVFFSGKSFAQETQTVLAKAADTRIQVKKIEVTGSTQNLLLIS